MPLLLTGVIGAPIVGGLVGNLMGQGAQSQALAMQQQALTNLMNVNTPEAQQLAVSLQKYQSAGQLAPQMESIVSQSPSLMNNVSTDPRLMNTAMQSMNTMSRLGQGGLQPQDLAALQAAKQSANQQFQGNSQAILQNMAQRGVLGSGGELAAQLSNAQSSANQAQNADLNTAANSSQRALQALQSSGMMGAQLQGQQFGQQAQIAAAQDAINRYNAMNSQQVGNSNVGFANAAQAQNLANAQNISNMNTGIGNQQALYNSQIQQQIFNDNLAKAQAATGQSNNIAGTYMGQAAQQQNLYGSMGQGVGQGLSAYGANEATKQNNANWLNALQNIYGKNTGLNSSINDVNNSVNNASNAVNTTNLTMPPLGSSSGLGNNNYSLGTP